MLTKSTKKIISLLLIISFTISILMPSQIVYAANTEITLDNETVKIKSLGSNSILVTSENDMGIIEITKDNAEFREVMVTSKDNEVFKFIYNKNSGTVYSTKTKNEINISDNNINLNTLSLKKSNPKIGDTKTKYISYYTIKNAVGTTGGIAGVAGFLLSFVPGVTAAKLGLYLTRLGGVTSILGFIEKGSKKHGIKITSVYYMRRVTKNGKVYKFGDWKLKSIDTY